MCPSLALHLLGLWACGQRFFGVVHMSTARLPMNCRKQVSCPGYVAHELSGFMPPAREALDEPDDMATGPQNAEISGCFEPLGAQGAIGDGGLRAFGMLGAAVSAVPAALRGGWACRAGRSPARQGVDASGTGGQAGVDAGGIPHASPGLECEAFPRAHPAAAWVPLGIHVDEDAAAHGRSG